MKVFPAIDLLDGQVVRLYQGDYQKKKVYNENPLEVAKEFEEQGANYLHLVDLDGARDGSLTYLPLIEEIVQKTNLFIEVGGGIRDEETIDRCLRAGVDRVIIGTLPQKNPLLAKSLIKKYGDKLAVGVDARDGKVAVEGWLETTETDAFEFCQELARWGAKTIIFTEISRDGTGLGLNISLYQKLIEIEGVEIVASGGVASIEDIRNLRESNIPSVILGKALYSGALTLYQVLKEAEG